MREVDSGALSLVEPTLGIGRPASLTAPTDFDTNVLQQVFDVSKSIRRGVSPALAEGIWSMAWLHEHGAAPETLESRLLAYDSPGGECASGTSAFGSGWPRPVPRGMDVWLLWANAYVIGSGSANFDTALLDIVLAPNSNAYNCNLALGNRSFQLVAWKGTPVDMVFGSPLLPEVGTGVTTFPLGVRLPRGGRIRWRTRNKTDAVDLQLNLMVGLMGAGLGQDAVGAG